MSARRNRKLKSLTIIGVGLAAACSTQTQPMPQGSVVAKTYAVPCDEAFHYAAKALAVRGLKITAVERSPAGGSVQGKNEKEDVRIQLACGAEGVTLTSSGGVWLEQGIRMSFANLLEQGERIWPPPQGPKLIVEQIRGAEGKIYFPQELEPLGMTAIRVRAVNGGKRSIGIDPRRIVGQSVSGGGAPALSAASVKQKLATVDPQIEGKILGSTELKQGQEARGFVFLPAGEYRSVVVKLVDVETREADEFEIFLND